jgi:hypothetical protein
VCGSSQWQCVSHQGLASEPSLRRTGCHAVCSPRSSPGALSACGARRRACGRRTR